MDLPDGELGGKVGPWAHLMTLHNAWLCLPFRGLCCADFHITEEEGVVGAI